MSVSKRQRIIGCGVLLTPLLAALVSHVSPSPLTVFPYAVLCCLLLLSGVLAFQSLRGQFDPAAFFSLAALGLGLCMLLCITPLSVPDEHYHYLETLQCSDRLLPIGMASEYLDLHGLDSHQNTASGLLRVLTELFRPMTGSEIADTPVMPVDYPLLYLPQILGLSLGRLLRANFVTAFLMGRLAALLFYVLCLYKALCLVPRYKLVWGLAGILPMSLHQAASYSYDSVTFALSLLFTALVCRVIWDAPLPRHTFLRLAALAVLLVPTKSCVLLLLLPAIPAKKHFGSRKRKWFFLAGLVIAAVLLIPIFQPGVLSKLSADGTAELNWQGGHNYTLSFLLRHPREAMLLYLRSFRELGLHWAAEAHGLYLSGLSLPVHRGFIACFGVLLLAAAMIPKEEEPLALPLRLWLWVVALTGLFCVITLLLLTWTSDDHLIVDGVQGRYFTALLPLIYTSLSLRLPFRKASQDRYIALAGALCGAGVIVWILYRTIIGISFKALFLY